MTLLQISDAIADMERQFGETPVELLCGRDTWNAVSKYFSIDAQSHIFKLFGIPVSPWPHLPRSEFIAKLGNGRLCAYMFQLD